MDRITSPSSENGSLDSQLPSAFPVGLGSSKERRESSSPSPSLVQRVPPPRNEEEWADFIDKYISYGFVTQSQLFLPPAVEQIDSQQAQQAISKGNDLTPKQQALEFPLSGTPARRESHQGEENAVDTVAVSPDMSDYAIPTQHADDPRRPSMSNHGSNEEGKYSHAMSTCSTGSISGSYDHYNSQGRRAEAHRIKTFYDENGFMCAPSQLPRDAKKRLRAIRRLGFDRKDGNSVKRNVLDKYTRMLTTLMKAKMSTVTILGAEEQLFPTEVGLGIETLGLDLGFCTHTALSSDKPLVVENADEDWRFAQHPMVQSGSIKSYCGAPLRQGKSAAVIGTLCVIDNKPRPDFGAETAEIVKEMAACVSNELELLAKAEEQRMSQQMHDVALRFSRQWLQKSSTITRIKHRRKPSRTSRSAKGDIGAIAAEDGEEISIYDEACQVVAETIGTSCSIIDCSAFHISYPQSEAQSTVLLDHPTRKPKTANRLGKWTTGDMASAPFDGSSEMALQPVEEDSDEEPAPDRLPSYSQPKVYHLPKTSKLHVDSKGKVLLQSGLLGRSDEQSAVPENLTELLMPTIVHHLKTRQIWFENADAEYEEDFVEPMLQDHSAALLLPVFDNRSQIPFFFVARSRSPDDLFAFDSAVLSFVESICSTILGAVLRHQLTATDEAQRSFAAMANHELKTPLHQILMCANDLRETLEVGMDEHKIPTPAEKEEMFKLCDIVVSASARAQGILTAVVDYHTRIGDADKAATSEDLPSPETAEDIEDIVAEALHDAVEQEKLARAALGRDLSRVETIVEIAPRKSGWTIAPDCSSLKRVLESLLLNAYHATEEGYILVTCEDMSGNEPILQDLDAVTRSVRIRIKDSGKGMSEAFCQSGELFKPFTKEDEFSPGAGLGIALAQKAIEGMGGSIRYESLLKQGTLITIEVPLEIYPQRMDDDVPQNGLTVPHCALVGFEDTAQFGIRVVGDFLTRKLQRRNAVVCPLGNANVVIIEERALNEAIINNVRALARVREIDTIVLGSATSKRRWRSNPPFLDHACSIPTSMSSESERRRSSVWTAHSSRASFAGSLSYGSHLPPESPAIDKDYQIGGVNVPAGSEAPAATTSIPSVTAEHLKNDLQALKQCLPASHLKVLIVEDNAINRQVLARMIKKLGHPYEEAEDGGVGVAKYKAFHPSLVLMDIDMPVLNGFEASTRIRAYEKKHNLPKAPIVAVTAIRDEAAIARGKNECQIDHWLVKPLGIKILTEQIKQLYDIQK